MEGKALVDVREISFAYDRSRGEVLTGFNLQIQPGTCVAILGPNGAGKTTLLHLCLGWLKPKTGEILFNGTPLRHYSRRELGRQIALVPQFENVPYEYTLIEYVTMGRAPYLPPLAMPGEADYQIAGKALDLVGIGHLAQRPVTTLSGGEKQMVLLARALAQQPKMLLLDEPSSHLDLGNKIRLVRALQQLRSAGVTILMTTHEPDLASAVADSLVLMKQGAVIRYGPLNDCLTSEWMSQLYGQTVQVVEASGRRWVVWD